MYLLACQVRVTVGDLGLFLCVCVIIIMYIYHALINALSAHIIHINLNMIFSTHVEHSPNQNNLHKVLSGNTQTHTLLSLSSSLHYVETVPKPFTVPTVLKMVL